MLLKLHCSSSDDIQSFLSVAVEWLVLLLLFRNVLATNFSYSIFVVYLSPSMQITD